MAGCVAQAEGAEIPRRAPAVDIVVGPQAYHNLPRLVADAVAGKRALDTDMPAASKFDALPRRRRQGPAAFLTVQEGCDKFCTYCVVPYTRGAEISRPWAAIVDEAKALVDAGAREITLLGQNVNAWAGDDDKGRRQGLDGLIRALDALPGVARIRYMTSHPNDMSDGLIAAHGDVAKLMPFLHLPVQAGSDRILKAMNRSHDVAGYLKLIERVRAVRPDIAISGDFIVGFPGETEADFAATLALVGAVGHAQAFSFKYSPRPGTPAATMADQIAPEVMDERLQRLQALLNKQQHGFNLATVNAVRHAQAFSFKYSPRPGTPAATMGDQVAPAVMDDRLQRLQALLNEQQHGFNLATVGRRCEVLIERDGKRPGQRIGKSPWLQSVIVENGPAIGELVNVDIVAAGPNSMTGEIVAGQQAA